MNTEPLGEDPVDLLPHLAAVLRRKWMILGVTLAASAAAAGYSLTLPNVYSATTKFLPQQQDQGGMAALMGQLAGGLGGLAGGFLGKGSAVDMYIGMLKSDDIKDALVDRFRLMEVYRKKYRSDAYAALAENCSISAGAKDGIVSVTIEDRDPKRAAALADAYVDELAKFLIRLNSSGAGENRVFLENRLAVARGDLSRAEDALKAFQAKNKALDVPEQARASIEGVARLRAELAAQEVQLATLRRSLTDSSQEVRNVLSAIENIKAQIARLEGKGGGAIPSVGSVPALGQEYVRLTREFKVQEALVELLTKQYEVTKLSEAKNVTSIQLVQKARVPEKKAKPKRVQMVVLVSAAAFLFSVLAALFLGTFDRIPEAERVRWRALKKYLPFMDSQV